MSKGSHIAAVVAGAAVLIGAWIGYRAPAMGLMLSFVSFCQ